MSKTAYAEISLKQQDVSTELHIEHQRDSASVLYCNMRIF